MLLTRNPTLLPTVLLVVPALVLLLAHRRTRGGGIVIGVDALLARGGGLGAWLGAVVLHTAWDATTSGALHVVIGLISVGALLRLALSAHRAFSRRAQAVDHDAAAPVGTP
ncbi:hypothetical protein [Brachybacterium hainanense]|uniref:Uncharacterized protein n=1 Tax=Brachybacterium hainanense TaxID=1541174 RepID=A0ABV6R5V5_9MICO